MAALEDETLFSWSISSSAVAWYATPGLMVAVCGCDGVVVGGARIDGTACMVLSDTDTTTCFGYLLVSSAAENGR